MTVIPGQGAISPEAWDAFDQQVAAEAAAAEAAKPAAPAAPADPPADPAAPAATPATPATPAADLPPQDDEESDILAALAETQRQLKDLSERIPAAPAATPAAPVIPPEIQAGLDHDDAAVRSATKALWDRQQLLEGQLATLAQAHQAQALEQATVAWETQIDAAVTAYTLTEAEVNNVTDVILARSQEGKVLTFDEGVKLVYPARTVAAPATPKPPPPSAAAGKGAGATPEVATVLGRGAASGTVPRKYEPKPESSFSERFNDAFDKVFPK